jgi:DNA-directed RNA polymerase specialized sigma24 family protein
MGSDILRLHNLGWSATEIAQDLRTTSRTIQRWRSRLGLSLPVVPALTEEQHALIRQLHEEGYPLGEIARIVGAHEATIKKHHPDVGWTPEQASEYARMLLALEKLRFIRK